MQPLQGAVLLPSSLAHTSSNPQPSRVPGLLSLKPHSILEISSASNPTAIHHYILALCLQLPTRASLPRLWLWRPPSLQCHLCVLTWQTLADLWGDSTSTPTRPLRPSSLLITPGGAAPSPTSPSIRGCTWVNIKSIFGSRFLSFHSIIEWLSVYGILKKLRHENKRRVLQELSLLVSSEGQFLTYKIIHI